MHNRYSLVASTEFLCHMTPEEKKAYNKKYYQEHKDYWREYYGRISFYNEPRGHIKVEKILPEILSEYEGRLSNGMKQSIIDRLVAEYGDLGASNYRVTGGGRPATTADIANAKKEIAREIYDALIEKLGNIPVSRRELEQLYEQRLRVALKANGVPVGDSGRTAVTDLSERTKAMRQLTPELNKRLKATGSVPAEAKTLGVPYSRYADAVSSVMAPAVKKSKVSEIADSAVSKGKSIVKNFASLWKLGWK